MKCNKCKKLLTEKTWYKYLGKIQRVCRECRTKNLSKYNIKRKKAKENSAWFKQ